MTCFCDTTTQPSHNWMKIEQRSFCWKKQKWCDVFIQSANQIEYIERKLRFIWNCDRINWNRRHLLSGSEPIKKNTKGKRSHITNTQCVAARRRHLVRVVIVLFSDHAASSWLEFSCFFVFFSSNNLYVWIGYFHRLFCCLVFSYSWTSHIFMCVGLNDRIFCVLDIPNG